MLHRLLLLSCLFVLSAAAGCGDGEVQPSEGEGEGEGEGEAGEGEGEGAGEGEGEGEGEGGEGEGEPPPNDTCAGAIELVSGTTVDGTTADASVDAAGNCDFSESDVFYTFTLTETSGVRLTLTGDAFAVSIVNTNDCEADESTTTGVCQFTDFETGSVTLEEGSLEAGTWRVAVDSVGFFFRGTDFSIGLEVVEPFCVGDTFEDQGGNNTADTATVRDSANIDTTDLDLTLCSGDVDYFLIGHMGGPVDLAMTTSGPASFEVYAADVDIEASLAQGELVYTEGALALADSTTDADLAAGWYLIKAADTGTTDLAGTAYSFLVDHDCEADFIDDPVVAIDEAAELDQAPVTLQFFPQRRSLCGEDVDIAVLEAPFAGDMTFTISASEGINGNVSNVDALVVEVYALDVDGNEVLVDSTYDSDTHTATATIEPGVLHVRITAPGMAQTLAYEWTMALPGLTGPIDNVTCDDATELVVDTTTFGRTNGATDTIDSACGFHIPDFPRRTNDVYYRFTLDAASDVRLGLESVADFFGSATVYTLPDQGCPADLSTLVQAEANCVRDGDASVDIPQLPAGDYLVVIEEDFQYDGGVFSLRLDAFPDGFPPPASCIEDVVATIELPAAGESLTVDIAAGDLVEGGFDGYGDFANFNGCIADGDERAFMFVPSSDAHITVTTTTTGDTVLGLMSTTCSSAAALEAVCDDGGVEGNSSLLEVDVVAGETYFLVYDHYSTFGSVAGSMTIAVE
jgi:hypothetical protein